MGTITFAKDPDGLPVPHIAADIHDQQLLLQEHTRLMRDLSAAHRWFDDPNVSGQDKADNWLTLFNMRDRQRFIYQLCRASGLPDEQIMKDLDLPF